MYYQYNTKNISFLKMSAELKSQGVRNNKFFLQLYDKDLMNVDPHSPNLDTITQAKIYKEIIINYWYYAREVVRIPTPAGNVPFELNKGNLATEFCQLMNINSIEVLPRQHYKTYSAVSFYSWIYLFIGKNYQMVFSNKQLSDSQLNIKRMSDLIDILPTYLKSHLNTKTDTNNINLISIGSNNNSIKALSSPKDRVSSDKLGRGMTIPCLWLDEFAFLLYNEVMYKAAKPALNKACELAKKAGLLYGILITTTPNNLDEPEGKFCHDMIQKAAVFTEDWYDWTETEILDFIDANSGNNFVFIQFTYKQLGKDDKWIKRQIKELENDMLIVKRELLLEWTYATSNSPFSEEQLTKLQEFVKPELPYKPIFIDNYQIFIIDRPHNMVNKNWILSVDVAGGLGRDNSAFTLIDPSTLKPVMIFYNNLIPVMKLSQLIISFVSTYVPNAIVIPERNNAGITLIEQLINSPIKKNVYFEEREDETVEKYDVNSSVFTKKSRVKKRQRTIVYGMNTTTKTRDIMFNEILYMIINDKPYLCNNNMIFNEIKTLVRTSSNKIEHASGFHDDILCSYLIGCHTILFGSNINKFLKNVSNLEPNANDSGDIINATSKSNNVLSLNAKDVSQHVNTNNDKPDLMNNLIETFQKISEESPNIKETLSPEDKKKNRMRNILKMNK